MYMFDARNISYSIPQFVSRLANEGTVINDKVKLDAPVVTTYHNPLEHVPFFSYFGIDPFNLFFETLGFLACSDDGSELLPNSKSSGFYIKLNELSKLIGKLNEGKNGFLPLWRKACPVIDTSLGFNLSSSGHLNLTVYNLNEDVLTLDHINSVVKFSLLLELVAYSINTSVGHYYEFDTQVETSYQFLKRVAENIPEIEAHNYIRCPYALHKVSHTKLIQTEPSYWLVDLKNFLNICAVQKYQDPFFRYVAFPILNAKNALCSSNTKDRFSIALSWIQKCQAKDWRLACETWITNQIIVNG